MNMFSRVWIPFGFQQQQAERGAEAAEGGELREDERVVRPKRKLQLNLPPWVKVGTLQDLLDANWLSLCPSYTSVFR